MPAWGALAWTGQREGGPEGAASRLRRESHVLMSFQRDGVTPRTMRCGRATTRVAGPWTERLSRPVNKPKRVGFDTSQLSLGRREGALAW